MSGFTRRTFLGVACTLAAPSLAKAETPEQFYKGKVVSLYVGTSAGGGYDTNARLIARYIGRYIPGHPQVIVRNMPGSGGMAMCNYIVNAAVKDGLSIAVPQRTNAFESLLGDVKSVQYDPLKLQWIGNTSSDTSVTVATKRSGVKTWQDLKTRELIVAVAAPGAAGERLVAPVVLRNLLGLKFKVIGGYPGANEQNLAMLRGEVDGRGIYTWTSLKQKKEELLDTGEVIPLLQMGLRPHRELPNVPLVTSLAETDEQRKVLELMVSNLEIGRPLFVADGVPPDRIEALRRAFDMTMKDKELLEEAEKLFLDISPMTGEQVSEILKGVYATPKPLVDKLIAMSKLDQDSK